MLKFKVTLPDGTEKEMSPQEFLTYGIQTWGDQAKTKILDALTGQFGEQAKELVKGEIEKALSQIRNDLPAAKEVRGARPLSVHRTDSLIELEDGSLIDMRRRVWQYAGEDASKWAKAVGAAILAKKRGTVLSSEHEQVLADVEAKYLNEDRGPQGGWTVPPQYSMNILQVTTQWAALWPLATVIPVSGIEISFPKLKQVLKGADATNPDYFAGVMGYWTESGELKTESQPQFEQIILHPWEYAMLTYIQNALLESSAINILNYLNLLFSNAYTWGVDTTFFSGSGTGRPLGILNDPQVITVGRTTTGAVKFNDVNDMQTALPDPFHPGSVWFMNRQVAASLRQEKDTNGQLLIQMAGREEMEKGYYDTLLGRPIVYTTHKTAALGSKGDIILGNPAYYYVGDRGSFTVDFSSHYQFAQNRTTIRGSGMVDGKPAISKAFVILDSTLDS
jgi:HK97 family phage major capsid protein